MCAWTHSRVERQCATACAAGLAWARAQGRCVLLTKSVLAGQPRELTQGLGAPEPGEGCSPGRCVQGHAHCAGYPCSVGAVWRRGVGGLPVRVHLCEDTTTHTPSRPTLTPSPGGPGSLRASRGRESRLEARRGEGGSLPGVPRARLRRGRRRSLGTLRPRVPSSSHGRARRPEGDEASAAEAEGVWARRGARGGQEARETLEAGGL